MSSPAARGDRNVPWPSTPGNLQHSRRRFLELGRRHPPPRGRASSHQLHSKAIRGPQTPHCSTYFSLLRGWGSLPRRAFLSHCHWFFPVAVSSRGSVFSRITTVWQTIQFEDPIQANIGPSDILTPQTLRPRHIPPHNSHCPVLHFTNKRGRVSAAQIQREGWTSH
jgi:hypothetical protein